MRTHEDFQDRIRPKIIALLPPRLQRDLKDIPEPNFTLKQDNLYIYGKQCSGKTVLATFLMLREQEAIYLEGGPKDKQDCSELITVVDLIDKFKACYEKSYQGIPETQLLDHYQNLRFLVLDDFGAFKPTDWAVQLLYSIIDHRYNWLKKTIFTSNLSLEQVSIVLEDSRITSRMDRMCEIVNKESF
jgi:DNA replication protein DnaC